MAKGIFIVGTDTDVGKTIITAGIMYLLRKNGHNATYFKAALSGAFEVNGGLIPGDTKIVSELSCLKEPYENITPYVYKTPVSPHLAAKLENKAIDLNIIREKYEYLKKIYEFIVAEGSGGIVCPLIDNKNEVYSLEHLIKDLNMDVILVARAGLGTINHVVLTVKYIESLGLKIKGIIVNNYEDNLLCNDNIKMMKKLTNISVIGKMKNIKDINNNMLNNIRKASEECLDIETIVRCMGEL